MDRTAINIVNKSDARIILDRTCFLKYYVYNRIQLFDTRITCIITPIANETLNGNIKLQTVRVNYIANIILAPSRGNIFFISKWRKVRKIFHIFRSPLKANCVC